MKIRRSITPSPEAAAEACAEHVISVLRETLARQEFANFAISGGSTPRLLFAKLAAAPFAWDRVRIFWADERCVPPDDPASNYKLADETLIRPAHIPPRNVCRVFGELRPNLAASKYAADILAEFEIDDESMPCFDLVHLGMGPDAHTASLFPGEPLIENRDEIARPVFVEKLNSWRVTLLPGVLLAAREIVFLVAGEDKADALHAVVHDPCDPRQRPAQLFAGRATWFLDEAAALRLGPE